MLFGDRKKSDRFYVIVSLFFAACSVYAVGAVSERPPEWAVPIQLDGVPNLYKVTDNIYRSAQPTAEGMRNLEKFGLKHIISLRASHPDKPLLLGTSLALTEVKMTAWDIHEKDIIRVLKILRNTAGGPYLIHCQHGADRTGLVCAMYRIVFQNWTKEAAVKEMVQGGYGFHKIWNNIVDYVRNADIDRIREKVLGTDQKIKIAPQVPGMIEQYRAAGRRGPA